MTIYDLMKWKVGNANVNAEFLSALQHAVRAAKAMKSDTVSYYLHELEIMRRMYNATLGYCNDERRISYDDVDRICVKVWRLYRKTMKQTYSVKNAG